MAVPLSLSQVMRILSKRSTAQCHLNLYTLYLLSEPLHVSCLR
ncbi:MAG: IS701 family transposase, partial [Alkalinema sp. RU_4_3]|nr:IS701 family transposase [Alkalinema sp. RU_4_3]